MEYFQKLSKPSKKHPLHLAFENFEFSYEIENINLAFLSLINALEVLLKPSSAQTDLTYRLSRNAAVLLGEDKNSAKEIYKKLNCLYSIRSTIVHIGEPKDCKKTNKKRKRLNSYEMSKYLIILRGYVRQTIKEMCFITKKHGKDKDEILETLHESGFGQRNWLDD